jgi:glycosyltransferase involved in cell wall biosynthesis
MKRINLLFTKGPWFYAEYNLRLFFFLLFHKTDLLVSNDLDTLPANWLASRMRRKPHIHDCHEYFRGVPELNGRTRTLRIWKKIEDIIFPTLKSVYAVNDSIARIYSNEYGNKVDVIRNVPVRKDPMPAKDKAELGIQDGKRIILYQGAVNVDRGLDEAILSMQFMKTSAVLLIIGTGDVIGRLQKLAKEAGVNENVVFAGPIPFEDLYPYTLMADIGLSIEKDVSLNYHYCLPNKFLDYIQARIPVLISPLPEMKAIVERYDIGEMIESHDPRYLAGKFDAMLNDTNSLSRYRENLKKASKDLCWENEEQELMRIYRPYE